MDASFYLSDDTDYDSRVHSTTYVLEELFRTMNHAFDIYAGIEKKNWSKPKRRAQT